MIIFITLRHDYAPGYACFLSLFHAVTCFCNAGITLFKGGMQTYNNNFLMLITSAVLIVSGGLGFLTWHEMAHHLNAKRHKKWHALSLNTKIVLWGTLLLIIGSTVIIYLLEARHAFAAMNIPQSFFNALFQAVSSRSAGLLTVNIQTFHVATLFFMALCALIGTGPLSSGSGIKITTFAVFIATVRAAIFGRTDVEIKGRSIANDQVYKAIAIVSLSSFWIALSTFALLIIEPTLHFSDLFLESISAFTTLGISTGITPALSTTGKLFIIVNMIIGRIGSLTLILALKELRSKKSGPNEFSYPEERVLLS
jgi:trk system potassium uptake protein TrkH